MAKTLPQVAVATDTFLAWVQKTNYSINTISTECLTANTDANGALTVGNTFLNGILACNIAGFGVLRGGNVQSSGTLNVISNTVFSGAQINASSNVYLTGANLYAVSITTIVGNTTIRSNTTSSVLTITGNTTVLSISANGILSVSGNTSMSQNLVVTDTITSNIITANTGTIPTFTATNFTSANVFTGNTTAHVWDDYDTLTTSGTSAQLLLSYPVEYRIGKMLISVQDNAANAFMGTEILILNDGGLTYTTEYAILASNGNIATFTTNVNSDFVRLYVTPTVAAASVKAHKTLVR